MNLKPFLVKNRQNLIYLGAFVFMSLVIVLLLSIIINSRRHPITLSLPDSFESCNLVSPKKGNFNPKDYIFPFCVFSVAINDPLYQSCLNAGGSKAKTVCDSLIPGDCDPAGCNLLFTDPKFTLPASYNECLKIFTSEGDNPCLLNIPESGHMSTIKTGPNLYRSCLDAGGQEIISGPVAARYCQLKFTRN
jgi:hypothetical protein